MKTIPAVTTFAKGIGLGAGLGYLMDPDSGRGRRARIRDKAIHQGRKAGRFLEGVRAELEERPHGVGSRLRRLARRDARGPVDDRVLVERVRAKLGKHVTHPGSLRVEASEGRVILGGPILAAEVEEAIRTARKVAGVRAVENRLEVHPAAGHVPGLQGASRRSHEKPELLREYWSPALRLAAAGFGTWLLLGGMRRGGPTGAARMIGGASLFLRGWINRPFFGERR